MSKFAIISTATLLALSFTSYARAESWNYQTYNKLGPPAAAGHISLEEKDGVGTLRFTAPDLNSCYQGDLKAKVDRIAEIIYITVTPRYSGCDEIRFVLKAEELEEHEK